MLPADKAKKKTPYHKWSPLEVDYVRSVMAKYGQNWGAVVEECRHRFHMLTDAQILRKAKSIHRDAQLALIKPKATRWTFDETQHLYAAIVAHGDNWERVAKRHRRKYPERASDAVRRKGLQLMNPKTSTKPPPAAEKKRKKATVSKPQVKKRIRKNAQGMQAPGGRKRRQRKDYSSSPEPENETLEERKKRLARNQRRRNQRLKAKMESKGIYAAANSAKLLRFLDSPSP